MRQELLADRTREHDLIKIEHERLFRKMQTVLSRIEADLKASKANVDVEINAFKFQAQEEWKVIRRRLNEMASQLSLELSQLRTPLEMMKLDIVRQVIGSFFDSRISAAGGLF